MTDSAQRRSRLGWPELSERRKTPFPPHSHSRVPWVIIYVALTGLVVAVLLLTIGWFQFYDYVQGRGEARDRENARLEEQIRRSTCDLLDQLPEGGLLDRPREKYGCGPGLPLDQLSPSEQAQIAGRTRPQVIPPTATPVQPAEPVAPLPGGADVNAPRPAPDVPPQRSDRPEYIPPTVPPPVTDLVCDLLVDACTEETP